MRTLIRNILKQFTHTERARIHKLRSSTTPEDFTSERIAHLYQNHNLLEIEATTSQRIALGTFSLAILGAE